MTPLRFLRYLSLAATCAVALPGQDWTDDQLLANSNGFQSDALIAQLEQVGRLLAAGSPAVTPIVARIHGDHREYRLKIDRLLAELCDPNWKVREQAERTLIEIGGRARTVIEKKQKDYEVLEQSIRCARILAALVAKGTEQEDRERKLLQGLVRTALHLPPDERLLRSLRSALGHTDSAVAGGALRALGKHGGDAEFGAVVNMLDFKKGLYRDIALGSLARLESGKATAHCRQLLFADGNGETTPLTRTEAMRMLRILRTRTDDAAEKLVADLRGHQDPVVAKAAAIAIPAAETAATGTLTLAGNTIVTGELLRMFGDSFEVTGAFNGVDVAELSTNDCNTIDFPDHTVAKSKESVVFLNQGTRIAGKVIAVDPDTVKLKSAVFGDLTIRRSEIQGIAFDPELDRLVGASSDHDRTRLHDSKFLDGDIMLLNNSTVSIQMNGGAMKDVPLAEVAGMLFKRPRVTDPDPASYVRLDLVTGERLLGFVAELNKQHIAVSVPLAGAAVLPWTRVNHVEFGVGGGAMWGFTLIADYSDNKIVEVDDQGRIGWVLEDIFGAWDAECLDSGNLLITEFSVSRVQEVNRKGETVWQFEDLRNPYDADRLPNGNTLIADTFASRVIEVTKDGKIAWSYAQDIRPFDCDRLPNGNTLIADVLRDRVIEVDPGGNIVWEGKGLPQAHDADRLPNGNTLVTLRNKGTVVEIDRDGKVVFELTGLSSPSDADRLPNGNTIVAENQRVREFDRHGTEVWSRKMTWAVEVNRY